MTVTFLACCLFLQSLTPEIIEHAQAGTAALRDGRLDVAIREFRKVTELQPNSASAHANLGEAYFKNGDYSAATPELEHALQLNPALMGSHQTLGVALLIQGNPEGALPHLEKMRTPELLGLADLETGRLGSAIMALQAALDRQPDDSDLLYDFGRATALAAKQTFEQLAKINPEIAHKTGAATNAERRSFQEVVDLQKALARQPEDAGLLSAFSVAASLASKQAFDQVLKSDSNSARAHQILAERYLEAGHLSEAGREFTESLRLKPYTANVHFALGSVLAAEGNPSAAAAQFRIESKLQPLSANAFFSLGAILLREGQASAAVAEITHADLLKPDAPQILLTLGRAEFAAKDTAKAEMAWTRLLGVDNRSELAAAAHLELAALYQQAGKSQESARETAAYEKLKKNRGPLRCIRTGLAISLRGSPQPSFS